MLKGAIAFHSTSYMCAAHWQDADTYNTFDTLALTGYLSQSDQLQCATTKIRTISS